MKKSWPLAALVLLSGAAVFMADAQDETKPAKDEKVELKTLQDEVSYAIGMNLSRQFPIDQFKLNPDI